MLQHSALKRGWDFCKPFSKGFLQHMHMSLSLINPLVILSKATTILNKNALVNDVLIDICLYV